MVRIFTRSNIRLESANKIQRRRLLLELSPAWCPKTSSIHQSYLIRAKWTILGSIQMRWKIASKASRGRILRKTTRSSAGWNIQDSLYSSWGLIGTHRSWDSFRVVCLIIIWVYRMIEHYHFNLACFGSQVNTFLLVVSPSPSSTTSRLEVPTSYKNPFNQWMEDIHG